MVFHAISRCPIVNQSRVVGLKNDGAWLKNSRVRNAQNMMQNPSYNSTRKLYACFLVSLAADTYRGKRNSVNDN